MHADLGLGKIITTPQKRDAIHVAVAPVTAVECLNPGEHVDAVGSTCGTPVGIVDPYLKDMVMPGEKYWLFLYPNTVTGLRHDWNHPSFVNDPTTASPQLNESEVWLRMYARKVKPYEKPEEAYANLLNDLRSGEMFYHGRDMHCRGDLVDEDELKEHGENVLGISLDFGRFSYSCSC